MKFDFPKDFLWGAATSAHQVEGNNINSDSWLYEHLPNTNHAEPSLDACDHYHRYPEDIALFAALGFNAFRFSIEWARVEPEEGYFSPAIIAHYRRVLECCHKNGIKPVVTLQHNTSPRWLIAQGGWAHPATPAKFARYCGYVAKHLGDLMGIAFTINQPNLPIILLREGHLPDVETLATLPWVHEAAKALGTTPEKIRPHINANSPNDIRLMIQSHLLAVEAIKNECPKLPTGWTVVADFFETLEGGETRVNELNRECIDQFLEVSAADDIVGLQAYTRFRVGPQGIVPPPAGAEVTDSYGWEYYPEVLERCVNYASSKIKVPLLITENGVATTDDSRRVEWIKRSARGAMNCLQQGHNLHGYLYWSAMDNFEWAAGYRPQFGLIGVNRQTQERTVKGSARLLGQIARQNAITV